MAVSPGIGCIDSSLAGCLPFASIILIPCAAGASSPKVRAGCGKAACPDLWRGSGAILIPTPIPPSLGQKPQPSLLSREEPTTLLNQLITNWADPYRYGDEIRWGPSCAPRRKTLRAWTPRLESHKLLRITRATMPTPQSFTPAIRDRIVKIATER